jgi:hypothetical protein
MLYFFATCIHTIRTLPALQHDDTKAEDVDTEAEDHAADETRYACMARPYVRASDVPAKGKTIHTITLDELYEHHERDMAIERRI